MPDGASQFQNGKRGHGKSLRVKNGMPIAMGLSCTALAAAGIIIGTDVVVGQLGTACRTLKPSSRTVSVLAAMGNGPPLRVVNGSRGDRL